MAEPVESSPVKAVEPLSIEDVPTSNPDTTNLIKKLTEQNQLLVSQNQKLTETLQSKAVPIGGPVQNPAPMDDFDKALNMLDRFAGIQSKFNKSNAENVAAVRKQAMAEGEAMAKIALMEADIAGFQEDIKESDSDLKKALKIIEQKTKENPGELKELTDTFTDIMTQAAAAIKT